MSFPRTRNVRPKRLWAGYSGPTLPRPENHPVSAAAPPSPSAAPSPVPDYRRWPLYWFSRLENAIEVSDLEAAAEAQRELERLGLRVELLAPWQEAGVHDAD